MYMIGTGNCSAESNNVKLVHWPFVDKWAVTFGTARMGLGGLSVPITIAVYWFNVPIKGLMHAQAHFYHVSRCIIVCFRCVGLFHAACSIGG